MLKSVNRPSERTEFAYVVDVRSQREFEFQKKKGIENEGWINKRLSRLSKK